MPQGPLSSAVALNPGKATVLMQVDEQGALLTNSGGTKTVLNITAATVIKATPGRIARVSVIVAGSTNGSIYDHATTSGVAAANQVGVIPEAIGSYDISLPCLVGIVVTPGTGQTIAVSYI